MSEERVLTVLGNKATRPISEFGLVKAKEWYVGPNKTGDGDDGRSGRSLETSLETLDAAIDLAVASTASKSDIIWLTAGYTETVSTAAQIALDKIGLRVIGLGTGANRPTFTFSAVDATITMTAASCSLENVILIPSIDEVVSGIVVSAADCTVHVEVQDANDIEFVTAILTTAGADRLDIDLKYLGDIGGDACIAPIQLVGVDTARIHVDFYGVADTAVVNFITTVCLNIDVTGYFNNVGTALTKSVVDTEGNGSWSVRGWDGVNNAGFSGGDNAAIASDDIKAILDLAAAQQLKLDGVTLATAPTAASLASFIASGGTALGTQLPASFSLRDMVRGKSVTRAAEDILDGTQSTLFTVGTGRILLLGLVAEVSGAAVDATPSATSFVTNPTTGTDMAMCATLDVNAHESGSLYSITGAVGDALSGGSGGGAMNMVGGIVVPEGTIDLLSAADAGTGGALLAVEAWYIPLDAGATLVAI